MVGILLSLFLFSDVPYHEALVADDTDIVLSDALVSAMRHSGHEIEVSAFSRAGVFHSESARLAGRQGSFEDFSANSTEFRDVWAGLEVRIPLGDPSRTVSLSAGPRYEQAMRNGELRQGNPLESRTRLEGTLELPIFPIAHDHMPEVTGARASRDIRRRLGDRAEALAVLAYASRFLPSWRGRVRESREDLGRLRVLVDSGEVPTNDLLEAEEQVALQDYMVENYVAEIRRIGLPPTHPPVLPAHVILQGPEDVPIAVRLARADVEVARSEHMMKHGATFGFTGGFRSDYDARERPSTLDQWNVMVAGSIPLLAGGSAGLAEIRVMQDRERRAEEEARLLAEAFPLAYEARRVRADQARVQVEVSERALAEERVMVESGESPLRLIRARSSIMRAEEGLLIAIAEASSYYVTTLLDLGVDRRIIAEQFRGQSLGGIR